jgi:spore maturation protein A
MINVIWYIMLILSLLIFLLKGDIKGITSTMTFSAEHSIELLIGLAGIMAVWSGMMKICEKSGMVDIMAKILSPTMKMIFPGLKRKNPKALGNIIMNISTNMMGLSNAATPFGIKAMEELQLINPEKDRASDYMVTFLIVNAACIQILPTTVISIMAGLKSQGPTDIIVPGIITTLIALVTGLISGFALKKLYK